MASIQTAIRLNDQMTAPLKHMSNAVNMLLSSWDDLSRSTGRGLNVGDVESIRYEMDQAVRSADQLGNEQEQFNQKVREGSGAVDGLVSKLAGLAATIGFAKIAKDAIEFASDLTEVQNVVDVSFGTEGAEKVNEWATTTLNAFGLNELSAKQYAGTMGAMLKSSGLTDDSVEDMSMRITELAGDMASFYNLEGDEAFAKIRSGISGETEPLKQLGINMSVANLEAFNMARGIDKAYESMSQAEQVALRYDYLMKVTADAQGDFARTSDSFANQQKLLQENWKALTGEIASSVLPVLAQLFQTMNGGLQWMTDHITIVMPLLAGLVGIIATYTAVKLALSAATAIAAVKQWLFNSAVLACPIFWIIAGIVALIAIIYAVVNAINKAKGTTISALGVIVGAVITVGAVIWNAIVGLVDGAIQIVWLFITPFLGILEWILNAARGGFDSFGGAVANLIGQIISWFLDLGKVVTKIIDAIFGTDWTGELNNLQDKVLAWGKSDTAITINRDAPTLESWTRGDVGRIEYGDAYAAGYNLGEGLESKIGNMFNPDTSAIDSIAKNTDDITGATQSISDSLDVTNEDLKYLRDLAEQETINRFTTAEVKVDLGGITNNVNSNVDLDGVVDYLTTGVQEALERVAEGVH